MTWKKVNEMLILALIDQDFCQELLADPLSAIQRYSIQLTEYERQVMSQSGASDLTRLSQDVVEQLMPEQT